MPQLIAAPTRIPVPGNKIIEEYIGRVNSGDAQASIARMRSPAGWSEPGQRPEFDEYTIVLQGTMRVEHDGGFGRRRALGDWAGATQHRLAATRAAGRERLR